MNNDNQILRIKQLITIINENNNDYEYIDWDSNYGKTFRIVHTPEGATENWNPDLISVVTPENSNAWFEWVELPEEKLTRFKKNWDEIQKTLPNYKYEQIIRSRNKLINSKI